MNIFIVPKKIEDHACLPTYFPPGLMANGSTFLLNLLTAYLD